jgi:GTP pyrophosphokinase
MKSHAAEHPDTAPVPEVIAVTAHSLPAQANALARARAFAEPLLASEVLDTGENTLAHADAVAAILKTIGGSEAMQAASYLVYTCEYLNKPQEVIAKAFGESFAELAVETTQLVRVQRQASAAQQTAARAGTAIPMAQTTSAQTENVRKMLLAFSRDLRVVMLRLASRLQTLRHFAATKLPPPPGLAAESLQVFAPLANRLGIWQIKWEMEDLSFRFLEPDTYKQVARLLDGKRTERETSVAQLRARLERELQAQGIAARVQGRPKHIYSIVKKMRGKSLGFEQVYDLRALRVIVDSVPDCYAALSWVHSTFQPLTEEFDDYIARPKPNGYQSLHTIVRDEAGQPIEIQIRTQAMHDHAEHGVAAHWAYKEAGTKGYAGVTASGDYDAKIAVLRQLLAWERDLSAPQQSQGVLEDRIYVLTPDAAIIELPQGATPIDFAYSVHSNLGHRCRGARVDGALVPLNTPLKNGQTVEVVAAKEGGPSRDWLNPELGFLVSPRARAKVRAWFNAQAMHETMARGREAVEKLLQREGKTALKLEDLAAQLGLHSADELFEQVGKDALSLRSIEAVLRPPAPPAAPDEQPWLRKSRSEGSARGGVLVVGVDSLLTQLAKCCKPAPPDPILGFVTRGKGVSVHRADCANLRAMAAQHGERVIEVEWGRPQAGTLRLYPVDITVEANERPHLLRDVLDVFSRDKLNVVAAQNQSTRGTTWLTLTVEVPDSAQLAKALGALNTLSGVRAARRR